MYRRSDQSLILRLCSGRARQASGLTLARSGSPKGIRQGCRSREPLKRGTLRSTSTQRQQSTSVGLSSSQVPTTVFSFLALAAMTRRVIGNDNLGCSPTQTRRRVGLQDAATFQLFALTPALLDLIARLTDRSRARIRRSPVRESFLLAAGRHWPLSIAPRRAVAFRKVRLDEPSADCRRSAMLRTARPRPRQSTPGHFPPARKA